MSAMDILVLKLVSLWRKTHIRQNFAWLFFVISVVGSIVKELQLIPETYFSNSRNVLNVYFVKVSWGWTLLLLFPFITLSNAGDRGLPFVLRRLSSLAVATGVWYACTHSFFYIEDATGGCYESRALQGLRPEFTCKADCRRAGLTWHGFDISGHSFILAYSALVIVEEMAPMVQLKDSGRGGPAYMGLALDLLYLALNGILVMWIWMFACTAIYFHTISHKLLGTSCAILGWYLTYQVWYPKPLSPGLPPLQTPQKRQA
ncbi:acyl-coenzyme A diphosphatase FITM2 [Conger conger]|uniref:acyl-coenzyme A diphosphatase FITM2 n=1 Tax=Conger conger TaxID=82655 RepID=UPI002A59BEEC|nr:acyl-coenzyme A diphosphatase FITM2 [Conger conger]